MKTCSSKTTTVIRGEALSINCFADLTEFDTRYPDLYRADLLGEVETINGVNGVEGELIVSTTFLDSSAEIEGGQLVISLTGDDENKYSINQNGELIYNG